MPRIGILGGSFDPVHYGHLLLAECCHEQCNLDEVWFVPAATNPHKPNGSVAGVDQRLQMLSLAIAGHPAFLVSDVEQQRGGTSYTVETLEYLQQCNTEHEFVILMGADSLADFPQWKQPQRICELAVLSVVRRADCPPLDLDVLDGIATAGQLDKIRAHQVEMPCMELTSTGIRQRIAARQSIRFRTPRAVEQYIGTEGLYVSD